MNQKFYSIEKVCKSIEVLTEWNKIVDERKKPKKKTRKKGKKDANNQFPSIAD